MDLSCSGQTSQAGANESGDGATDTPKLVYQSDSTAVYRLKDKGIKVLLDENPSEEQILQLVHEHNISKFLPPACRKRHVLDVKGFKGDPAVYFQWTRGKTLAEWLTKARKRPDVDLNVRLRVAISIAETLFEFHDVGVVYNNLSPSNIVLDTFEGSYVATLIDLSEATIFYRKNDEFARWVGETDLRCLGSILYDLFHINRDHDGDDEEDQSVLSNNQHHTEGANEERKEEPSTRTKRGRQQSPGEDLPMYLGTLISTLLLSGESDIASHSQTRYESAKDVLLDLRLADKNPQIFVKPPVLDDFLARGQLQLPEDAFYGRQSEISMLLHALSSVTLEGQSMMVSISGYPGAGKTSLVNQIKKPLQNANGFFVAGKFDVRARSDAVMFSALDAFYSDIMIRGADTIQQEMRPRILKSVGSGCGLLMKSIPSLETFLGEHFVENTDTAFRSMATEQRWKYLLCKLVAATSSKDRPLVLFLDDLQWADETSLDVFRMMVTDPDIRYCLFVGVYRDNLLTTTQRLKKLLYGMQEQGVSLVSIRIGPIEKESVHTLLSETLCLPPRLCQSLSTIIHNKIGGIALFVINFLKSLNEEGLLWFNLSSRRWEFDLRGIELKEISVDVVEHMSERMTRLPNGMQSGLRLCACLGSRFDAHTLQKGFPENAVDMNEFVRLAIEGGYIRELSPGHFMWAHDQIQQAAYDLIPETRRESFHLLVGSRIFLRTTPADLDGDLFTIVGNMNIGVGLIKSQQQKLEVARLNLRAGEMAIASSSFNSAAKYLMLGIALLPDDSWVRDYDLTIRLYDAATESTYVAGDFDTLSTIIQTPLLHARSFDDKLSTYHILVRYLIASGQVREGISKGTSVLAQLGETVPENVDSNIYEEEVAHVKRSLMDLSEDDLLRLPPMTDECKLACIQFMNIVVIAAYCVKPLLAPILVFRMVRLSVEHGVCNISAFAFASYGAWLVSAVNSDFEGGYRMGRLAITLMNRLEAQEFIPRVNSTVYGFINIWKEPFQAGLPKLLEGYEAGSLSGDVEYAFGCLFQYVSCALYNYGEDLGMLEKSVRLYIRRAIQCNQNLAVKSLVVVLELILILTGSKESAFSIFSYPQEEALYQEGLESDPSICRYILLKRKFLAFFIGDIDAAAELFEIGSRNSFGTNARSSHLLIGTVIDGLIAFFFARKHQEDENHWRIIGEAVIDLTRQWATNSSWNFTNKLYLLEAEHFFLENDETKALAKYEQSIKAAQDHHFIHEEGLAFEREAQFHLHYGRNGEALVCFTESKKCYTKWGAQGLAN